MELRPELCAIDSDMAFTNAVSGRFISPAMPPVPIVVVGFSMVGSVTLVTSSISSPLSVTRILSTLLYTDFCPAI